MYKYIYSFFFLTVLFCNSHAQELQHEPREVRDIENRPPKAISLLKLVPSGGNDSTKGFRVAPGSPLVERYPELEQDDVLLSINGIVVSDEDRLRRALRKLVRAESMELTVLRGGKYLDISIPLK